MATRDRRPFVAQAIRYFMRQDYPCRELLVLDDGDDCVEDLVPDDERVRYLRLDERLSVGAKRNLGCDHARGELIAHWDDDDWISPRRLSIQTEAFRGGTIDVCGTDEVLHYRLEDGDAWRYHYSGNGRPWLCGGTLMYRRSLWRSEPFANTDVGEDTAFVDRVDRDRIRPLADTSFYVALIHKANTAAKDLGDPRWERRPLGEVTSRLGADTDFYVHLRNRGKGRSVPDVRRVSSSVTLAAPLMVYDGYGSVAEYLARGMVRAGATVNLVPLDYDPAGLSDEALALVGSSHPDPTGPVLYYCWPRRDLDRFATAEELYINTMWETSRLPADWPQRLNRARAVIVPTRFVADVCCRSGVTAPIEVVPEGIDADVYTYEERPERDGLTTLVVGTVIERKNTAVAIAAWQRAFDGDPSARLVVKTRFGCTGAPVRDPRIRIVDTNETTRGIRHWYAEADILLALGNEGFGLPLVEGMATGLPVIALDSEGQSDTIAAAGDCVLKVAPGEWKAYDDRFFGHCGVRGVPAVDDVVKRLRWVAAHRGEARAMGREASAWARRHRDVWLKAPAVLDAMERRLAPPRPLRRARTMWVPSWGTPCGVAEYARDVRRVAPWLQVTATPPAPAATRLVHIQHEPGLFDELTLARRVEDFHDRRVRVVITEHMVERRTMAFEGVADALVSTTAAGAAELRRRWPSKRVEHIPLGCPMWFPPRKHDRGRVVGTLGLLHRHKGFWELLDLIRERGDIELVLFSHARSPELARDFDEAAAGLPVRRVTTYAPAATIARELAARADALVFWYSEAPAAVSSGAVRTGLSTGVPVLTSPTDWFAEVREATYQPTSLAEGIERLLGDTSLRMRLAHRARDFCERHSWKRIAERHDALWTALENT